MDFGAVIQASDDILNQLGLVRKGDILSLRGFCEGKLEEKANADRKDAQDETKRKLLAELFSQKKKKQKRSQDGERGRKRDEHPKKKVKTRRIQLGWLHFDEHSGRFVAMRLNRGGGTREVDVPLSADVSEIIHIAQEIFFPEGRCAFGNLSDMDVALANFKCERLESSMSNGEPLTLQLYIDACKATRIRVYIQTKRQNIENAKKEKAESVQKDEELDDDCLLVPTFDDQRLDEESGSLIGSSTEREQLKKEQERELLESLSADQNKRRQLCDEIQRAGRQLSLREARSARVEAEPGPIETKVNVSVRHILLGVVSRPFHLNSMMSAVYDWIGSLSLTPENFTLCTFDGSCLLPSESVQVAERTMLYMAESDDAPDLTNEDSEVNFKGFGTSEPDLDGTLPLTSSMSQPSTSFDVCPIPERPPEQLFEEHDSPSTEYV